MPIAAIPLLGIYKGGDENNVITAMTPGQHTININVATNLKNNYGIKFHHRLNWPLDGSAGSEPATLMQDYATLGFTIGAHPVPYAGDHDSPPNEDGIIRNQSFVSVTPPHNFFGHDDEAHDYLTSGLRTYFIQKTLTENKRCRIYYGSYNNLVSGLKLASDWGNEPEHIIHVTLNSTTEYLTITGTQLADRVVIFNNWMQTKNKTYPVYVHFNVDNAVSIQKVIDLTGSIIYADALSAWPTIKVVMPRVHDPGTGGAFDTTQNVRDGLKQVAGWF